MKIKTITAVIILLVLAASCKTYSSTDRNSFSDSDYTIAMQTAMKEAGKQAFTDFYKCVESDMNFIPESYAFLLDYTETIPGIDTIFKDWKNYVSELTLNNLASISPSIDSWLDSIEFGDAKSLALGSLTSGTGQFKAQYKTKLIDCLEQTYSEIDTSYLSTVNKIFTAYCSLYSIDIEIKQTNIAREIATSVAEKYIEILSHNEELYRTTPNPYASDVVSAVFGLE